MGRKRRGKFLLQQLEHFRPKPGGRRAISSFARVMAITDTGCDRNERDSIVTVGPERLLRRFRNTATDRVRVRLWRERASEVSFMTDDEIVKLVEQYFRDSKA